MLLLAEEAGGFPFRVTLAPLLDDHGIPLAVMGMSVVFLALLLVGIFIGTLPRLIAILHHFHPDKTAEPERKKTKKPAKDSDELPEETVVVIAAAVAAVVGEPHRVVRIRGLTPEDRGWSLEGRMRHHTSHTPHQRG
jgi:sodium pump decarboxylase gamma subunit